MLILYLLLILLGGGAILICTINTQYVNGKMWREKALKREVTRRVEPARRGTIFSSDGKVLATTVPVCDLCLDLGRWERRDSKGKIVTDRKGNVVMESCISNDSAFRANLPKVCKILHEQFPKKSEEYYYKRILSEYNKRTPSRCFYVERRVPYSQWEAIRDLPGWGRCVVTKTSEGSVTSYVRAHIYGNLGETTIGLHYNYNGKQGYVGLEGYYDSVLRGQDGEYVCRRLTRGTWLPEESVAPDEDSTMTKRRVDGKSIIATIDTRYQDIAESSLRKSMNQFGGQRGCAILMEVSTGYILACSNLTRDTSGALSEKLWDNVAISDHYEPGSTFKTVAMTAMLSDKTISLDTSKRVQSGGQKVFSAKGGVIRDDHGNNHDTANLAGVLAVSSNVGMASLAWEYYRNRREDFRQGIINIFPFGKMEPDVKASETPTRVSKLPSDRDFLNLSYGYSAMVTPLQVITFYNAIANGGRMLKPLFCKEIMDNKRNTVIQPVVLKEHMCSEEIAKQMREMLIGVVKNGTGNNIDNPVYGIGGKTGTALGHGSKRDMHNSSFVGFFPADNPRYTCLVLVEETSIAGRQVAAPVFKQIADCVVAFDKELGSIHLRDSGRVAHPVVTKGNASQMEVVHQLLGLPYSVVDSVHSKSGWVVFDSERECYQNYVMPKGQVPDCLGMTIRDAQNLLHKMGMKVRFTGQGKVVSQSPKARTTIVKGGTVVLELKP